MPEKHSPIYTVSRKECCLIIFVKNYEVHRFAWRFDAYIFTMWNTSKLCVNPNVKRKSHENQKKYKFFFVCVGCIFLLATYVVTNRYWLNATERSLLKFLQTSTANSPIRLMDGIFKNLDYVDKSDYMCILMEYQTRLEYKNTEIPKEVFEKIGSELSRIKYRDGNLGILSGESHWSFIFLQKNNYLKTIEISANQIPMILSANEGDCFKLENVAIEKVELAQYPHGFGLRIFNLKLEEKL